MQLKEILTNPVETVGPESTLLDAAKTMLARDLGWLPVEDEGKIIGIITDRDIAIRGVAAGLDTKSIASTPFLEGLRDHYRGGAEFLAAADVATMIDHRLGHEAGTVPAASADGTGRLLGFAGLDGVDRFVITAGEQDPGSATVSFRDERPFRIPAAYSFALG